jgi:glycine hydroxymethyltransferase
MNPGGLRLGTPALTSRGLNENDFDDVADFLTRAANISVRVQEQTGKKLKDWEPAVVKDAELLQLQRDVADYAMQF